MAEGTRGVTEYDSIPGFDTWGDDAKVPILLAYFSKKRTVLFGRPAKFYSPLGRANVRPRGWFDYGNTREGLRDDQYKGRWREILADKCQLLTTFVGALT